VLITREGMSIRFSRRKMPEPMGRPAVGVYGIDLAPADRVVALAVLDPTATLLVAGENGIGKRTVFDAYRIQSRGGKGIITMKTGDKTGAVVGALDGEGARRNHAHHHGGQMVRTGVKDIAKPGATPWA